MKISSMTHKGRFSTRGRFTIPVALRRKFGLKGGSRLALEVTPTGAFIFRPLVAKQRKRKAPDCSGA